MEMNDIPPFSAARNVLSGRGMVNFQPLALSRSAYLSRG